MWKIGLSIIAISYSIALASEIRLTTDSAFDDCPRFSLDGTMIAFDRWTEGGIGDIWVMNSDGSNQVNITNTSGIINAWPCWSPDGSKIAFSSNRTGKAQIWSCSPTGANLTQMTDLPYNCVCPDWSPSGTKLAFTTDLPSEGEADIYIYDIQKGIAEPMLQTPYNDLHARWSKAGDRIAYNSDRGPDDSMLIFVYNLNTQTDTCITPDGPYVSQAPCWLANDTKIMFYQGITPHGDLWEVGSSGGPVTRFVNATGSEYGPDVSSDGVWVVYSKETDLNVDIYKCLYSELGQLTVEPATLGKIKASFR